MHDVYQASAVNARSTHHSHLETLLCPRPSSRCVCVPSDSYLLQLHLASCFSSCCSHATMVTPAGTNRDVCLQHWQETELCTNVKHSMSHVLQ
jgi:hypothetical protein